MKRLLTIFILSLFGLSACDAERGQSPLEPETADPSMAKQLFPDFAPPEDCSSCLVEPMIMVRGKGSPTIARVTFDGEAGQEVELVVYTSDPKGATVKAWLNHETVLLPSVIPQSGSDQVRIPLALEAQNLLEVRLSGRPGSSVAFWVEGGAVPTTRKPLWTDVGVLPTGSSSAPAVVADNAGLAILLLTDPASGAPQGAASALPGMDGFGLVRFDPSGIPVANFFGGGAAYFEGWSVEGGTASVSVFIPSGGALPATAVSVALPGAWAPVVDGFLTAAPTSSPGAVFEAAQLQSLSQGEALAAQAAWCALELAGALPATADACRTSLIEGVPIFWDQWTEDIGYEPFLPTVTGSLNLGGCTGADCLAQAEVLAFTTIADATPRKLNTFSGDAQNGTVGAALADPIQVLVTNEFDAPLGGFLAEFSVTSGGGLLDAGGAAVSVATDGSGVAGVAWTLGSETGDQGVGASTISFADLQAGFTATAEAAAASTVFKVTSATVSPTADKNAACVAAHGAGFGIADWNDVVAAVASGTPKNEILDSGTAFVLNNTTGAFTVFMLGTHHYMLSATASIGTEYGAIGGDFWLNASTQPQRVLCMGPST
jgi:hypothetical protein